MNSDKKRDFYIEMGKRIKARRLELKMSQDELAVKAGFTSRTSVSKIESGNNGISQLMVTKLAEALDTTPDYIQGWEKAEDEPETVTLDISPSKAAKIQKLFALLSLLSEEELNEEIDHINYTIYKRDK